MRAKHTDTVIDAFLGTDRWNVYNPYLKPLAVHVRLPRDAKGDELAAKALEALAGKDLVSPAHARVHVASVYGDRVAVVHQKFGECYILVRDGVGGAL